MSEVRGEYMSEIRAGEGSTSQRQDFEVGRGGLVKGKIFRYYLPLKTVSEPVLRIRIHRIHMFLGLPDPLVRGTYGSGFGSGSGSFCHHAKIVRKTFIHTIL